MQQQIQSFINELKANKRLASFDEAATKQAVVLRMLSFLGWDFFNVEEVYPNYAANSSHVSYSLRTGGVNKIFVDVKKTGEKLDDHQKYFVNLSSGEGLDFAVLTNGIAWWFYLTSFKGGWQQKWFYSADLLQPDADACVSQLLELLSMEKVVTGQALKTAKDLFRDKNQKIASNYLPNAWNEIITEPNTVIVELLSLQTEKLCGLKIDIKSIENFLGANVDKWLIPGAPSMLKAPPGTVLEHDEETLNASTAFGADHNDEGGNIRESYTDKSIKSFTFIGHSQIVRSWDEVLPILCDYFVSAHEKDFEKVLWISDNQKPYFSRYSDQLRIPEKIQDTDIYVETRMKPDEIVKIAYKLLDAFGYGPDDLSIDAR